MELSNKTALITGGASGMGAATAAWLAKRGMRVIVLDHNKEAAERFAKQIACKSIVADICDAESVQAAVDSVADQYGALHVCVNCAGIAPAARIVGRQGPLPLADFQRVIQINLVGAFNIMRCVAARMIQQDPVNADGERGVLINTASIAAEEGQVGQAAYSASKAGVIGMTLPAAREFSQFGIRVMAIAPGVIATPLISQMPADVSARLSDAVPFPKRLGNSDEYAMLVQQIIENTYLNGSVIRLDAAMRMGSK